MKKEKRSYEKPVITKVKFEDKALVSFSTCSKETRVAQDDSCCDIRDPNGGHLRYNMTQFDQS